MSGLYYESLVFFLVELLSKIICVWREEPRLRKERKIVFKNFVHAHKIFCQIVFPCDYSNIGRSVNPLERSHLVDQFRFDSNVAPINVPFSIFIFDKFEVHSLTNFFYDIIATILDTKQQSLACATWNRPAIAFFLFWSRICLSCKRLAIVGGFLKHRRVFFVAATTCILVCTDHLFRWKTNRAIDRSIGDWFKLLVWVSFLLVAEGLANTWHTLVASQAVNPSKLVEIIVCPYLTIHQGHI